MTDEKEKQPSIQVPIDDMDKVNDEDANTVDQLAVELAQYVSRQRKLLLLGVEIFPLRINKLLKC